MAKLISTNQQLRAFLGGAYSASDDFDRIKPYIELAEQTYIAKAISSELLLNLEGLADSSSIPEKEQNLLQLTRRALAFYGYWMYLPFATGVDGDNGLQETTTERTQPIRLAVLEKRIATTADYASQALESVLLTLFNRPDDFPVWKNSDTYENANRLFLRNGTELKTACSYTRGHHRLYLSMSGFLEERQRKTIVPMLGEEFSEALLEAQSEGNLTAVEKKLLLYVQRALGYAAYEDALMQLTVVQLPNGGLRVLSEFDGINNQRSLTDQDKVFCEYKNTISTQAQSYLRELRGFLDANADDFPLYTPPTTPRPKGPIDNSQYNTVIRMR